MFDVIVITAANEAQAAGYREQVAWRRANGFFDDRTDVMVVPDPGGRRVGSLGATLNVLVELERRAKGKDPFKGRRILVCHSGGDSRRTPAYAAMGKAFTPLPCVSEEGRPLALFDLIVREADRLPVPAGGQLLVLSGDVLITVDPSSVDFSRPGLTGVAWFAEMAEGARHGVYVASGDASVTDTCRPVVDFLQKPSAAEASAAGAVDRLGRVAVDTGILSFDPALCRAMLAFARKNRRWLSSAPCLDVYEHFTYALVGKGEGRLARAFRGTPFHVNVLPFCEFFHMGSSRELLARVTEPSPTAAAHSFRSGVCAEVQATSAFTFDSCADAPVRGREGLVEGCWLAADVRLGGANILTGVPRECTVPIRLPKETGLVCMPIGEKDWTAVSYRLDDNFKSDGKWDQPIWRVGSVDDAVAHALAVLRSGPPPRARGLQPLSALIPRVNHARLLAARSQIMREVTRRRVAEEVSRCVTLPTAPRPAGILHDQVVWVTSPVRIDFAGGWSDTPPICLEQGGTVLNAAVTLNGQYPIQVMAKLSSERRIRVSSIDLGDSRTFTSATELQDHSDPHDWCAIPKAALVLTGIVPSQRGASLGKWLATLGGGLDLTIFSALPKGSGMGTSSVLGAAVLACLDRVLGVPFDAGRLIRMTSVLEQRMQTGGGWQDQIGGLLPGVKLISTRPGADQTPTIRAVPFDAEGKRDISSRCLLYFTGQKRMARNILGNVVNRYVSRAEGVLGIVSALKRGASAAADCLARHDVSGFAARVQEYWELKKKIDPGSTNAGVEELMARVRDAATATLLPGAGGGGFILVIAKSAAAARRLRADLESNPPNPYARVFDFDIDPVGLKVTVL